MSHKEQVDRATILQCKLCPARFSDGEKQTSLYKLEQHIVSEHIYDLAIVVTPATDGF